MTGEAIRPLKDNRALLQKLGVEDLDLFGSTTFRKSRRRALVTGASAPQLSRGRTTYSSNVADR
jgi:hypothetical protein